MEGTRTTDKSSTRVRVVVAGIAIVCLLTTASGCSWMMGHPTRSSEIMDVGFVTSGMLAAPAVLCHARGATGDDGCLLQDGAAVLVGIPVFLAFSIASSRAAEDDEYKESKMRDGLPERPTDTDTLQLAHQVQTQVDAHQCVGARVTMNRIAERDAEYHMAMLAKGVLGTCAIDGPGKAHSEPATVMPTVMPTVTAPSMTPLTSEPLPDIQTDDATRRYGSRSKRAPPPPPGCARRWSARCRRLRSAMCAITRRSRRTLRSRAATE
jgi:hypothetical protein